jgi:ADP-ribosylation factor family protein
VFLKLSVFLGLSYHYFIIFQEKKDEIIPTVGFDTSVFKRNNVKFQVFDMGGQVRYFVEL